MDFSQFEIAGVNMFALVLGLVEFVKKAAGLEDKAAEVLAVSLGAIFIGLAYSISNGYVPEPYLTVISIIVVALGGAMSLSGYYKLIKAAAAGILDRLGK
jgi:hypothetical protein